MKLAEFKKIVAAWPDHEGDGAFDEDAQVWIETGRGLSSPVTEVTKLNQHDMLIESNAFAGRFDGVHDVGCSTRWGIPICSCGAKERERFSEEKP